jgi:hypothetical protein
MTELSKYGLKSWKKNFVAGFIAPFAPSIALYLRARVEAEQQVQSLNYWTASNLDDNDEAKTVVDYTSEIVRFGKCFAVLRMNENAFEHFTQVSTSPTFYE